MAAHAVFECLRDLEPLGRGRDPTVDEGAVDVSQCESLQQDDQWQRQSQITNNRHPRCVQHNEGMVRDHDPRALIGGMIDSGMDITGSGSEGDLRARVARRLGTSFR